MAGPDEILWNSKAASMYSTLPYTIIKSHIASRVSTPEFPIHAFSLVGANLPNIYPRHRLDTAPTPSPDKHRQIYSLASIFPFHSPFSKAPAVQKHLYQPLWAVRDRLLEISRQKHQLVDLEYLLTQNYRQFPKYWRESARKLQYYFINKMRKSMVF